MSSDFLGIAGYRPTWERGAAAISARWGAEVLQLVGARLEGILLLYGTDGYWLNYAPVLLNFGHKVVEVCHNKFDEISITNDSIDPTRPVSVTGERWGQSQLAETSGLFGQAVASAGFIEWCGDVDDLANGMVALQFVLGPDTLVISNGLDENAIEVGPPDSRYRAVGPSIA